MLTAVAVALLIGTMVGLLLRPGLDAYLLWKSADLFRRIDDDPSDVGYDADRTRSLP